MGQQQLLLVILVTIIVGIATVVAINTFSSAADSANVDAVRQDLATIAASAQGYFMKPEMLGGGGNKFTNITFRDISFAADTVYTSDYRTAVNQNGVYVMGTGTAGSVVVTGHPASKLTVDSDGNPTGTADATDRLEATITKDAVNIVLGTN
ncbi:MAG: hypothetical protein WC967_02340 [Balneolaceae bacterium]